LENEFGIIRLLRRQWRGQCKSCQGEHGEFGEIAHERFSFAASDKWVRRDRFQELIFRRSNPALMSLIRSSGSSSPIWKRRHVPERDQGLAVRTGLKGTHRLSKPPQEKPMPKSSSPLRKAPSAASLCGLSTTENSPLAPVKSRCHRSCPVAPAKAGWRTSSTSGRVLSHSAILSALFICRSSRTSIVRRPRKVRYMSSGPANCPSDS